MNDEKIQLSVKASADDRSVSANISGDQKAVRDFFNGIVPEFVKDGVGILSDQVKYWRFSNQVKIIKKAQSLIDGSGLKKKSIPLKILVPIIEHSSLEEEHFMQDKWSSMLANAATREQNVSPTFATMLSELSPVEVRILDKMFSLNIEAGKQLQFDSVKIQSFFKLDNHQMNLIIGNLYRLNIVQPVAIQLGESLVLQGGFEIASRTTRVFEFTSLGVEFVKACRWK